MPVITSTSSRATTAALAQSSADLTLLNQSLAKSNKTTDTMADFLNDLDDRLSLLETSLVPIYKSTNKINRVTKNIESCLRSIDGLLDHHKLVETETPLIRKGPDSSNLTPYFSSLERLTTASEALRKIDFGGQATTIKEMNSLVDEGIDHLVRIFTKWTQDASPTIDAGVLFDQSKTLSSLPYTYVENVTSLFAFLRHLPNKSVSYFSEIEASYVRIRSRHVLESTEKVVKDVIVSFSLDPSLASNRTLGKLWDIMLALFKYENSNITTLFTPLSSTSRREMYASIIKPSLSTLLATGSKMSTLVSTSPQSFLPQATVVYAELLERRSEFAEWAGGSKTNHRKENECGELISLFGATCVTHYKSFITEILNWGDAPIPSSEANTVGVPSYAKEVLDVMRFLSDHQSLSEPFLKEIGKGQWNTRLKTTQVAQDNEFPLTLQYISDMLFALLKALKSRAAHVKIRQGASTIFMLNAISFLKREIDSSSIVNAFSPGYCDTILNKEVRAAKAAYLDIWSPLVSAMLDGGLSETSHNQGVAATALKAGLGAVTGGSNLDKRDTKDRFVRFFDAFEDIEALHKAARLNTDDVDLRSKLKSEIERMIIPTYTKFVVKHRKGDFSKNPSKYLKLDANQLQARVNTIFDR